MSLLVEKLMSKLIYLIMQQKLNLKNVSNVGVSSFALKSNVASLKTEVHKIDADKLKAVPVDLAKLGNVVKNDIVKKTEYKKLVTKVDNIDTTNFVKKNKYEKDGSDFEDKISKIEKKYLMLLVWFLILIPKLLK